MKNTNIFFTLMLISIILACSSPKSVQTNTMSSSNSAVWSNKAVEGIDFAAAGNEPSWSLDIDFAKSMHFKTLDGFDITTPAVESVKAQDANVTRYHAQTEAGTLTVSVFRKACTDKMSGEQTGYEVRIATKKTTDKDYKEYVGCGRFLGDYRLNDIWALQQIGTTMIDAKKFSRGVPTLELQLSGDKVFGYGGCNRFSGTFKLEENKINFGPMAATKMACPGIDVESRYLSLLSAKPLIYRIEEGRLYLGEGDGQLVFKKVD